MTLKSTAIEFLKRGYSIIPLVPRSKQPLDKWAAYHTAPPTEEKVNQWWDDQPNANIGLVTGRVSDLVVVDVDPKRGGNAKKFLDRYPTDMVVKTGSGGFHLYYKYPRGIDHVPNMVGFEPGMDLRADGGMVVLPPSIHENGTEYVWVGRGLPALMPAIFAKDIIERSSNERGWISDLLSKGAPDGQRNDALAKLSGYFCSIDTPLDVALGMLFMWNERNRPPMPSDEVRITVESVYATAERRKKRQGADQNHGALEMAYNKGFSFMSFNTYMKTFQDQGVDWMIKDWLPIRTIAFAISPPGSFKTWLTLDMAISIATGTPFLGKYKVQDPGPVFLIQQEDYHGQTQNRLDVIMRSRFDIGVAIGSDDFEIKMPPKVPIFIHPDRKLKFADDTALAGLESAISDLRPKLIIIDPLYSAGDTTDYMAKTATQMMALKTFRDRYGCSFLIVHHTKKGAGDDRERLWGSSFLNAFMETGIQISKTADAEIQVDRHFKSASNETRVHIVFDIDTVGDQIHYHPVVLEKGSEAQLEKEEEVINLRKIMKPVPEMILDRLAMGEAKLSELTAELAPVHQNTIRRNLKKMVEAGEIVLGEDRTTYKMPEF